MNLREAMEIASGYAGDVDIHPSTGERLEVRRAVNVFASTGRITPELQEELAEITAVFPDWRSREGRGVRCARAGGPAGALQHGRRLGGPPERPLPRIRLEIRGGVVYATGVEVRST